MKKNANKTIYFGGCFILSTYIVLFLPQFFNVILSKEQEDISIRNIGIALLGLLLLIAFAVLLLYAKQKEQGKGKERFGKALRTFLLTLVIIMMCVFIVSLLSGVFAVIIDVILKNILTFDQIKGVIDIVSSVVFLSVMPMFVYFFWLAVYGRVGSWKSFFSGIQIKGTKYLKLLVLTILLLGVGLIISTMLNLSGTAGKIVAIILLSLTGMAGLICSEKICSIS